MGQLLSLPMVIVGRLADAAHAVMERLDHFMARANAAYYATRDPFADFTTAPEIARRSARSSASGARSSGSWSGRPDPVLLAEAGPGRATLMADALRPSARRRPLSAPPCGCT